MDGDHPAATGFGREVPEQALRRCRCGTTSDAVRWPPAADATPPPHAAAAHDSPRLQRQRTSSPSTARIPLAFRKETGRQWERGIVCRSEERRGGRRIRRCSGYRRFAAERERRSAAENRSLHCGETVAFSYARRLSFCSQTNRAGVTQSACRFWFTPRPFWRAAWRWMDYCGRCFPATEVNRSRSSPRASSADSRFRGGWLPDRTPDT